MLISCCNAEHAGRGEKYVKVDSVIDEDLMFEFLGRKLTGGDSTGIVCRPLSP